jgi:hypothetical protein
VEGLVYCLPGLTDDPASKECAEAIEAGIEHASRAAADSHSSRLQCFKRAKRSLDEVLHVPR